MMFKWQIATYMFSVVLALDTDPTTSSTADTTIHPTTEASERPDFLDLLESKFIKNK